MDITKFKHQHTRIYDCIKALHRYSSQGIAEHAKEIASTVVSMSSLIKLHLTVEDKVLYPRRVRAIGTRLPRWATSTRKT